MHHSATHKQTTSRFTIRDLGLGALAGLIGGLAMGVTGMLVALWYGYSPWTPLTEIAGVFTTDLGTSGRITPTALLLGTLVHFGLATGLGVVFALIYRGLLNMPSSMMVFPIAYGMIYGLLIWFISTQLLSNNTIAGQAFVPAFIVQHLIFGFVTGLVYGRMRPVRAHLPRDAQT